MLALRRNSFLFALCFCRLADVSALGRQTHTTVRHHPVQVQEVSSASALLDQAEALLAKGDYSGAQSLLEQATTKDPQSYQAWYDLGYVQRALRHDSEAVTAFRKSLDLSPNQAF